MMILKNPDNGSDIKDVLSRIVFEHPKGKTRKYEDEMGQYAKGKYGFLEEIYLAKGAKDEYKMVTSYPWKDYTDLGIPRRHPAEQAEEDVMTRGPDFYGEGLATDR